MHTRWPWPIRGTLVYLVVVGVAATLIFCAYMLIASAFGVNVNELFSGQSIIDSKSFLRLHIATDGRADDLPDRGGEGVPASGGRRPRRRRPRRGSNRRSPSRTS